MREMPLEAVISISVQLPASKLEHGAAEENRASECALRVFELLSAAGVPATWIDDDPVSNPTLVHAIAAGHEIGLRVANDLAAQDDVRSQSVADIIAGKSRAQQAGMAITTLALADVGELPAQLVAKYGFKAVCSSIDTDRHSGRKLCGPVALRYGLWEIVSDFRINGGNLIADWRSALRIRRAIDRAIRDRRSLHVRIDVEKIATQSSLDRCGGLASILRHIERRREAAQLQTCTVEQLVARLAPSSVSRAGGSILRAA